ncbi:helix-turn-helix domain-containing protein [Pseudoalteromonas sp. NBT06-2]|uniref:winged helix-turn-helix transcriptional regulator n=1 Tax=Pseudoalteromonas sp. NBT06-2 TaxID=2025950 RepID=UPI00207580BE|nr:helix-turn-helix domain-containing protein [Pseudoalteromonas sp. NBT06-2]
MRGSKTGKPIMALFDLLGRTWSLGIVWQLSFGDATFRELQKRCEDISPTLLNNRLKELIQLDIVERTSLGYGLTHQAKMLANLIKPMGDWSQTWAENYQNKNDVRDDDAKIL